MMELGSLCSSAMPSPIGDNIIVGENGVAVKSMRETGASLLLLFAVVYMESAQSGREADVELDVGCELKEEVGFERLK
jgi:hypothetical protein